MTTFKSVANLGEGNSVTKPCEAGLRTDTSGVLLQNPKQSWELHRILVQKKTWSFSVQVLQTLGGALRGGH